MADTYAVLRIRDFRLAMASKFFATLAVQMQSVVLGWQIYQLTKDPLALGMIGLSEALPYMACLLWAGHHTDRSEKQRLIVGAQGGMLVCALGFLTLTLMKVSSPWPIYAVIGLHGVCRSFLWPATAAYVDMTVPQAIYSQAAGWNSTLWQVGAILGPLAGGWLYAAFDAPWAYLGVVLAFVVAVWFANRMGARPPSPVTEDVSEFESILEGIRFVWSRQAMLAALSLDMFAVLFGGATALLPIFADRLGVGSSGLGMLKAALPAGALIMALYQAHRAPFAQTGRAMLLGVAVFGIGMMLFPLSSVFWASLLILAVSGAADNISVVVRASIVQAMTPNRLRGRVSSVNGLFISSSNEIGAFESGVAAKLLGVVPSVIFGGAMTLVCVLVTTWKAPGLRRLRLASPPVPGEVSI